MGIDFQKRRVGNHEVIELAGDPEGVYVLLFHGFGADAYDLLPLSQAYRVRPPHKNFFN